ncbi:HAD-IIIC family phosphatase [Paenibacillus gansuensis]|uniref:HAD-IIIC family phosphatase n=1 Tax=Paenibacillus gansuensis TaxID=306542 RepID=A0ABW5PDH6_9BACL
MSKDVTTFHTFNLLLGKLPARKHLLRLPAFPIDRKIHIRVERTLPFEFISSVLPPFMGLWGCGYTISYSDYDPSLSRMTSSANADVYLLWMDWRVYRKAMTAEQAADWLRDRIQVLRKSTDRPVLINTWLEENEASDVLWSPQMSGRGWVRELNLRLGALAGDLPGCALIDLASVAGDTDGAFYDGRNDKLSNYPFSDQASVSIARHLGVHLFPAVLAPRLKALALDLDDTLYKGVLGEDGIEGVKLTEGHERLQRLLLQLKESGLLLTLCSRNEEADVRALFEARKDFPLSWNDFAAVQANWKPKEHNIRSLAKTLNIDPSAFLFIDDNPAELLKVSRALPQVKLLPADEDGMATFLRLCHYPGLYQLRADATASVRTADIQANQVRETLKSNAENFHSYLESLQMVIRLGRNRPDHKKRLHELSHKTNQFNMALQRYSEQAVDRFLETPEHSVFTVQLEDALTDSGVVGAFVCRLKDGTADISEILFSCRALGREVETVSFAYVLKQLVQQGAEQIRIAVKEGPRNRPAREWLARFTAKGESSFPAAALLQRVEASCSQHPARVEEMR